MVEIKPGFRTLLPMNSLTNDRYRINTDELHRLFDYLLSKDYQIIGPKFRDGALMLDELLSFDEIPIGFHETLDKGQYQLVERGDGSCFEYTLGPQSFKKFMYPPKQKLWGASRNGNGMQFNADPARPKKMAFWGIRSCDLHAIQILDRIFLKGEYTNAWYKQAREELFTVAVGCTVPSSNCFCTTTGTGPDPEDHFDISLTEVKKDGHYFIMRPGSDQGTLVSKSLGLKKAKKEDCEQAESLLQRSVKSMGKRFEPLEASQLLKSSADHLHWKKVADKCLACANCTMVCPTCFCSTTEDLTDLTGEHSERWLRWDSCFNGDFSYIHGGKIRNENKSRYRQWITHKLSSWYDQFGTSGCVGCGRCITWCPVGIDITEELSALKG